MNIIKLCIAEEKGRLRACVCVRRPTDLYDTNHPYESTYMIIIHIRAAEKSMHRRRKREASSRCVCIEEQHTSAARGTCCAKPLCACHELNVSSKHHELKESCHSGKYYDAVCCWQTQYVIKISRTQWVMSQSTGTHTAMLCACHKLNAASKYHGLNEWCHSLQGHTLRCSVPVMNSMCHRSKKDSMSHVKVYRDTHCDAVCLQRTRYVIDISRTQWVMSQSTYFDPVHLSRT